MPALDDRIFESAETVELDQEQQEAIRQHFSDKGYDLEVENPGTAGEPPQPEAAAEEAPAEPPVAEDGEPAATAPPAATPTAPQATDADIDEDSRREFEAHPEPEKKLGRWAQKNKTIREQGSKISELSGQLEEARRQLAERGTAKPQDSSPAPLAAEPPAPEAPKPNEFSEARPALPKFEDFADQDDPVAAFANAQAEWNRDDNDWFRRKNDFEAQERNRVQQTQSEQDKLREWQTTRINDIRGKHPDFDQKTGHVTYGPVLEYLFTNPAGPEDGLELGYLLAQPENQDFFNQLKAKVALAPNADRTAQARAINLANQELAVFRYRLSQAPEPPAPPAPVPTTSQPAVPPPAAAQPTRREEAAPTPTRGRGTTGDRLEDIPPEDSDARRAWKKRHGVM